MLCHWRQVKEHGISLFEIQIPFECTLQDSWTRVPSVAQWRGNEQKPEFKLNAGNCSVESHNQSWKRQRSRAYDQRIPSRRLIIIIKKLFLASQRTCWRSLQKIAWFSFFRSIAHNNENIVTLLTQTEATQTIIEAIMRLEWMYRVRVSSVFGTAIASFVLSPFCSKFSHHSIATFSLAR